MPHYRTASGDLHFLSDSRFAYLLPPGAEEIAAEDIEVIADVNPSTFSPVIPASITQRQARIAMLDAGILDDVETAISGMTGVEGKKAQIAWEWASEIMRDDPLLESIAGSLGLDSEQIDQLFLSASII